MQEGLVRGLTRRDEGWKDQTGVFQHQRRGMEHAGE